MKILCNTQPNEILDLFNKYMGTDIWFKCKVDLNYYAYRLQNGKYLHGQRFAYIHVLSYKENIHSMGIAGYEFNLLLCDKHGNIPYNDDQALRGAIGHIRPHRWDNIVDEFTPVFPLETITTDELVGQVDNELNMAIGKDIWIKVNYYDEAERNVWFINILSKSGDYIDYKYIRAEYVDAIFNSEELYHNDYEAIEWAIESEYKDRTSHIKSFTVFYPVESYDTQELKDALANCEVWGYEEDDDWEDEDEEE